MRLVEPKDFEVSWGYKYVRFADGTVLFCDAADPCSSHKQVVDSKPDVPAFSAGTIRVRDKSWCVKEGGSSTAKLPRMPSDEKYIQRALEPFGYKHDEELWYSL